MTSSSLRVAVADDHQDTRDLLPLMLRAMGHRVVAVAKTGRELVEQCLATRPDLVITDIRMPELDGLEAARLICQAAPTPVILLTGHCSRELIQRAVQTQILEYLVKPVRREQLEPAIALARRRFEELRFLEQQAAQLRQSLGRFHAPAADRLGPSGPAPSASSPRPDTQATCAEPFGRLSELEELLQRLAHLE